MNRKVMNSLVLFAIMILGLSTTTAVGQRGTTRTDTRILYQNGAIMAGTSAIYIIWYGNWSGNSTTSVLTDLATNLGSSTYFLINSAYPDSSGAAPSGALIYAGATNDPYSRGTTLTDQDLRALVLHHTSVGNLLLDPNGIYLVIASADVTNLYPDGASTFCTPGISPHHAFVNSGSDLKYGFIGDAARCPTSAGAQFVGPDGSILPTPNNNFSADAMASSMARILSAIVTNPTGTGWYDRYELQNSDKCAGTFGTTYTTPGGARANMRLGQRDYLIQQNWVNARKGRCALSNL